MDKRQEALNALLDQANNQGYVTFDNIIECAEHYSIPIQVFDWITNEITTRGIIIYDELPINSETCIQKNDDYDDYAQSDYEAVYNRVVDLDKSLESFVDYVRHIVPPQRKEINSLKYLVLEKNKYARDRLIEMHLRLALKIALQRAESYNMDIQDAIGMACVGLVLAADKYNPDSNGPFGPYASMWILQNITRMQTTEKTHMHFPVQKKELFFSAYPILKQNGFFDEIEQLDCNDITKILKKELSLDDEKINEVIQMATPFESLEKKMEEFEDSINKPYENREDWVYSEEMVENNAIEIMFREQLEEVLETLTEREMEILKLRFGLTDGKIRTLEELGAIYNLTRERVRQIVQKALRKLRHPSRSRKLKDYLEYFDNKDTRWETMRSGNICNDVINTHYRNQRNNNLLCTLQDESQFCNNENRIEDNDKEAPDLSTDIVNAKNRLAVQAYANGEYEKAVELFKEALELDDENLTICSNLGAAYAALAKTEGENYVEEAIKYLNMAVDKKDANSAHTIAALYDPNLSCPVIEGIKSTDKAVYYYLKEIEYSGYGKEINPATALNNLGVIMKNQKEDCLMAAACLNLSFSYDSDSIIIKKNKDIYFSNLTLDEVEQAKGFDIKQTVSKILSMPNQGERLNQLGLKADESGNYLQSIKYYEEALKQGENKSYIRWNLGYAYYNLSFQKGIDFLNKSRIHLRIAMYYGDADAAYIMGNIHNPGVNTKFSKYWKPDNAIKYYMEAIGLCNNNESLLRECYCNLGMIYISCFDDYLLAAVFYWMGHLLNKNDISLREEYERCCKRLSFDQQVEIEKISNYEEALFFIDNSEGY